MKSKTLVASVLTCVVALLATFQYGHASAQGTAAPASKIGVVSMHTVLGECVQQQQYQIENIDITIIAQAPKLAPHLPAMREILAADLQTALNNISLKATTTEHMGFTGREEGIASLAVVLLKPND